MRQLLRLPANRRRTALMRFVMILLFTCIVYNPAYELLEITNAIINSCHGKNKVFSAGAFGFVLFYSYIFFRLGPRWGGSRRSEMQASSWCFLQGGKLFVTYLAGQDGGRRPLFLCLAQAF
jgi:hypothetical protein